MPPTNAFLLRAIDDVGSAQLALITAAQLAEIGLARSSVRHRARQGGPWKAVLPGIYALTNGPLTQAQRQMAALLYAGEPSALTGLTALRSTRVQSAEQLAGDDVHVLIPHEHRRVSRGFVTVERTLHWPTVDRIDGQSTVPVARATIDGCRRLDRAADVRAVVSEVVRARHATIEQLEHELRVGQRRRTALAREAVRLLAAGPVSVAEMDLYERWRAADLPEAEWNVDLFTTEGAFVARPDVYLPDLGVAFELDSLAFHYTRPEWEATMQRHSRMTALGLLVLHATPTRVRSSWPEVARELLGAIESRRGHVQRGIVVGRMSA